MAMVEIPLSMDRIRYSETDRALVEGRVRGGNEIVEEELPRMPPYMEEDVAYVALGNDVKESDPVLMYALGNLKGLKICILHVHQPAQKIPLMGTKVPINLLEEHQVKAYHANERQEMNTAMNKYIQICGRAGARAEKICVEMESVEKGIVQLIYEHHIKWLVMGAAANKSFSRKMKEPKSKKALHVHVEAPDFCHIWFVCKGNLIYERENKSGGVKSDEYFPILQSSPNTEALQSSTSPSVADGQKGQINSLGSLLDYRMFKYDNHQTQILAGSIDSGGVTPRNNHFRNKESALVSFPMSNGNKIGCELPMFEQLNMDNSSILFWLVHELDQEGNMNHEFHGKIAQLVAEAERSKRQAYEESLRRKRAEKDVTDKIHRAKVFENMYMEELRCRREIEENLATYGEEAEKLKCRLDEVIEELRVAQEQKASLESQLADSHETVEVLEQKMFTAVDLLKKYKKERDEFMVERDKAQEVAHKLRQKQYEVSSSSSVSQFFSEFSLQEIEKATNNFNQSLKIDEGDNGIIYQGNVRHTQVAIKILHPNNSLGPFQFQQEVNILSKLRHPNLVTLIGTCPEIWALIYEYLPNGSLEDCLNCKNNAPRLTWQIRIRIAAELCSALIFLHSCHPRGVIHGDLKPANILLDDNLVSKIGDFGTCFVLPQESSNNNTSLCCHKSDPKGTFADLLSTEVLNSKSDVYSFGIILLRLLTGRPAAGITKEVQDALDKGNLEDLLDPNAGDWPFVQAKQLAHLAISCSDVNQGLRPDLASEVWRVLEPMRVSCVVSSSRIVSKECHEIPSYFVCPIFQEIMQDPVVSADGFTYEAEALKGWLESGHDTSPMTNLKLPHRNLVQNHALRSAIKEWLQQP